MDCIATDSSFSERDISSDSFAYIHLNKQTKKELPPICFISTELPHTEIHVRMGLTLFYEADTLALEGVQLATSAPAPARQGPKLYTT